MSLIQKSKVNHQLSARSRTKVPPCPPIRQPNAPDSRVVEAVAAKADAMSFAEDFFAEHSFSGVAIAPAHQVGDSIRP
jgi:hypothetical protein